MAAFLSDTKPIFGLQPEGPSFAIVDIPFARAHDVGQFIARGGFNASVGADFILNKLRICMQSNSACQFGNLQNVTHGTSGDNASPCGNFKDSRRDKSAVRRIRISITDDAFAFEIVTTICYRVEIDIANLPFHTPWRRIDVNFAIIDFHRDIRKHALNAHRILKIGVASISRRVMEYEVVHVRNRNEF